MGDDLRVANVARVSFDKWKEAIDDKDTRLIEYLADHDHWSPFAHCMLSIRVDAPIFVARQLVKHQIGLVWNEVSRRYVDDEPVYHVPGVWRGRPLNAKQGSDGVVDPVLRKRMYGDQTVTEAYERFLEYAGDLYNELVEHGVAPEQARMVLPLSAFTSWVWTGSLYAFARVCNLRLDAHAQAETREVAEQIDAIAEKCFPVAWRTLV